MGTSVWGGRKYWSKRLERTLGPKDAREEWGTCHYLMTEPDGEGCMCKHRGRRRSANAHTDRIQQRETLAFQK